MERYAILLGYFDKQLPIIQRLIDEIVAVDITIYDKRFLFAIRTQQFYTAIEDLFKQLAKSFENHVDNLTQFHKEMLVRMSMEVPQMRPAVISKESFVLLDKVRSFRHFIRHAYDCELDENELKLIQGRLKKEYHHLHKDLQNFRAYIKKLTKGS